MDFKFKPWLRQVIKALHTDGMLDSTDITETIVSNYEEVEELFEHGLGTQLVVEILTEDLYDQENEDGGVDGDEENTDESGEDEWDNYAHIDDDEFPEENIDNITSEPNEDDDEGCSDGCGYKIIRFFDTRFASVTLLKSEHTVFLLRIFRTVHLI